MPVSISVPEIGKDERLMVQILDMEPIFDWPNHTASRRPGRGRRVLHSSLQDFENQVVLSLFQINALEKMSFFKCFNVQNKREERVRVEAEKCKS